MKSTKLLVYVLMMSAMIGLVSEATMPEHAAESFVTTISRGTQDLNAQIERQQQGNMPLTQTAAEGADDTSGSSINIITFIPMIVAMFTNSITVPVAMISSTNQMESIIGIILTAFSTMLGVILFMEAFYLLWGKKVS